MKMKSIYAAILGVAIAGAALPASAGALISNWTLGLGSSGGAVNTGLSNLGFNGESLVINKLGNNGNVTSTDVGVYNFTTKNGGSPLNLGMPTGQYTAVFQGANTGNLHTGSFIFTSGTLDFYYNTAATFGGSAINAYGAADGTKIGSFSVTNTGNPLTSGGLINANGTPTANGVINLTSQSTSLLSGFWNTSTSSLINVAAGFTTTNAHLDPAANGPSPYIDPKLVTALDNLATTYNPSITLPAMTDLNTPPTYMFVQNGGQFSISAVPEPGTFALLGIGMLGLGLVYRKRRAL